ncbi:cisplatin damage response ATP-dependent DNA ligase [Chthonobacter albigriseus]|uniref:cisplatin damage response ATP-dependent DNA ligase n=1 Tax=Chthonobacter albigriseus TaxID=1683161 RepID=UPI0015EEE979|nr:cisplatin damage response ATP-dependent DNA ligase [Chthonobacter albigriseus]
MNRFAALLDRLAYEPRRNAKIALVEAYLRSEPDPDRGYGLAALTGGLVFHHAKPGLIRALIAERVDPVLFAMSYDYVGDLSETVSLLWPTPEATPNEPPPGLAEVVLALRSAGKVDIPRLLARWLDLLDETGRFALLKLITGALRIGVSSRLAKTAVARLGGREPDEVEEVWHGLEPPYRALFDWIEGRGPRPEAVDPAPFRPPMLAHALEERDAAENDPALFRAEWKWDGIRVQAAAGTMADGRRVQRLFSRSGEDLSGAFPDLLERLTFDGAIDGELLVMIDGRVQPFATLQQRLNRKTVTPKLLAEMPAAIRAYDLLAEGGEDIRALPFDDRRTRLEAFVAAIGDPLIDLSPMIPFETWEDLAAARSDPSAHGAGADAEAVEGVMIKRAAAPYVPGRVKGEWFKWKRDPYNVDAVLMYAQRGHGKRSSFYSDYTFGVWKPNGETRELVPVGKAYFGFTDEELKEIDRFVRNNTVNRFGPVREVVHTAEQGLVIEVAFEGLNRSTRHKSGVAMRFPRVARLRWDKKPADADEIAVLLAMLPEA